MDGFFVISDVLGRTLVNLFFGPMSRVYLPVLAAGAMISLYVMWREQHLVLRPHERLISRETWASRSAFNDYGLIFANALVISLIFAPVFPDPENVVAALVAALPDVAQQSSWWAPVALALSLFVVDDFVRYYVHYAEHRVPALWELHKVHHSAEVLNFFTAERHHPLSIVLFQMVGLIGVVAVNTIFVAFFADKISLATLLGGNVFWVLSNLLGGALRHSPVWLSFGPRVERWLISPAQHQIHHSTNPKHFDCNFGGSLAIWDRMFGTLYVTGRDREHIEFGLGDETRDYASLAALYTRPIKRIAAQFAHRPVAA